MHYAIFFEDVTFRLSVALGLKSRKAQIKEYFGLFCKSWPDDTIRHPPRGRGVLDLFGEP